MAANCAVAATRRVSARPMASPKASTALAPLAKYDRLTARAPPVAAAPAPGLPSPRAPAGEEADRVMLRADKKHHGDVDTRTRTRTHTHTHTHRHT